MCSAVCCQGEAEGLSPADVSPSACLDRLQHCIFMRRTNLTIRDDGALVLASALHYKIFFVDLIASQLLPVFLLQFQQVRLWSEALVYSGLFGSLNNTKKVAKYLIFFIVPSKQKLVWCNFAAQLKQRVLPWRTWRWLWCANCSNQRRDHRVYDSDMKKLLLFFSLKKELFQLHARMPHVFRRVHAEPAKSETAARK